MGQHRQQQRRDQGQPEVAAVPQRQVVVVDVEEAEDDVGEGEDADGVEDGADEGPGAAPAQLDRAPDHGQGHSRQQPDRVGVGAVVDAGGVVTGVEEDPGERDRGERPGHHPEQQPAAPEQLHPGGEDERPEEVELLLDRERPEVGEERGALELVEVGLVAEDEVPVGDVGERGDRVAAQLVDAVGLDDRGGDHRHRDQHPDRRQQPPRPPQPEAPQPHVPAAAELAQQQRGDQVAADHEEDVDAEEAARHPADGGVVEEHREHRQRPQGVDPREVWKAAVLWAAHPVLNKFRLGFGSSLSADVVLPKDDGCIIPAMSTATVERPRSAGPGSGMGGDWRVIVRNDNHNTFEHVAQTLAKVLPGVGLDRGHRLANQIHNSGQAIVWSGPREPAEHYWELLDARRPDDGAAGARVRISGLKLAATLALVGSILAFWAGTAHAEPALPNGFVDSVALGNLEQPTNFRFAADGRVFVAEKPGKILVFENLEDTTPEVFADLRTEVYDSGDRGLLGIALDPQFTEGRPYVYALYTYDHILGDPESAPKWGEPETTGDPCPDLNGGDACLVSGRLVRLTAVGNQAESVAGDPIETVFAEGWCQQFSSHSVGDLVFGPEGDLYVSGGDGASFTSADYGQLGTTKNPCGDPPGGYGVELTPPTAEGGSLRAQNPDLVNGKILRVDPETGQGLASNPLGESADENTRRIVAEGFRNPFRFTFDPQTNDLYTGNVGSSEIEEIDRFPTPPTAIYNSGWPCYEGPERQFQFKGLGLEVCERLYGEEEAGEASTSEPLFYYSHGQSVVPNDECPISSGSAIGGISFYEGENFPAKYKGALFFADAVRGCIWVMYPGDDGHPDPATAERFMREGKIYPGVDIEEGADGDLYYADLFGDEEGGNGAIHRISYDPGAPTARLKATPPYGVSLPLEVSFDAGESSDPTGEELKYDWDMNGDGTFEVHEGGPTQTRTYTKAELEEDESNDVELNKVVAVRVTDGEGLSNVARVTVYPGDSPPQPTILSPLSSSKWGVGDEIEFEGFALDGEGNGIYTPLSYYWSTGLLHCPTDPMHCHAHPLQIFAGTREGSFLAPEHDYPSYIEVTLRVADDRGLTGSKTVKLDARPVELTLESSPTGVELTAGLAQGLAPLTMTAVEGDHVLLSAPKTAEVNGETYAFHAWSDSGARIHTVEANESTTYTAEYEAPEADLALAATPQSWNGAGELEVEFDASGSSGESLEYEWDTGSGFEAGPAPNSEASRKVVVESAGRTDRQGPRQGLPRRHRRRRNDRACGRSAARLRTERPAAESRHGRKDRPVHVAGAAGVQHRTESPRRIDARADRIPLLLLVGLRRADPHGHRQRLGHLHRPLHRIRAADRVPRHPLSELERRRGTGSRIRRLRLQRRKPRIRMGHRARASNAGLARLRRAKVDGRIGRRTDRQGPRQRLPRRHRRRRKDGASRSLCRSSPTRRGLPLKAATVEKAAPFTLLALQGSEHRTASAPAESSHRAPRPTTSPPGQTPTHAPTRSPPTRRHLHRRLQRSVG